MTIVTDWAEPKTIKEWSQRVFALRPILLILLVTGILILEMRFDWVERILGAYLVTTNAARPESGAVWEKGHRARTAQINLEKIITDRQTSQREARSAQSFAQIAAGLSAGQGAMLSAERFRQLYLEMLPTVSQEIISTFDLLKIAGQGNWRRTYFEKDGDDLIAYLLDGENRVLREIDIPSNVLPQLGRQDSAAAETLEDLPIFKNRIYPAARFFEALAAFPDEIRRNMILNPAALLIPSGQIMRVGISDEAVSGYIDLGFEFANGTRRQVVLAQGQDWAVWRLRSYIEGKDTAASPITDYLKDQKPR
jgi:hypothetical protein